MPAAATRGNCRWPYSKSLPAASAAGRLGRLRLQVGSYGLGAGEVSVAVPVSGVAAGSVAVPGVPAVPGTVVVVVVFMLVVAGVVAGEGFTIVVLVAAAGLGDVVVVVVVVGVTSVRCSQPARSAAAARMQMDFFIGLLGLVFGGLPKNRTHAARWPCHKRIFENTFCRVPALRSQLRKAARALRRRLGSSGARRAY